ncbi:MAG: hypothetical protein SF339_19835 [Blastocatellia bacterium]|nr:hypothetical protein [Blastocatellia bacterium]
MSEHNDHNLHPEHSRITAQPILMFLIILGISTAAVFVIVKGVIWGMDKMAASNPPSPATAVATEERKLPPEPRLQGAPTTGSTATTDVVSPLPLDDMKIYREQVEQKVSSYGWVNKEAGVARIPIDRAKELIAEKGLPTSADAAAAAGIEKAAAVRKQMLNSDSSAGRGIARQ